MAHLCRQYWQAMVMRCLRVDDSPGKLEVKPSSECWPEVPEPVGEPPSGLPSIGVDGEVCMVAGGVVGSSGIRSGVCWVVEV